MNENSELTPAQAWLIQSPPGLAESLERELIYLNLIDRKHNLFIKKQRNHDLIFLNKLPDETKLLDVRIAESIYRCPVFGKFKISKRQLQILADTLQPLGPRRLVVLAAGRHFDRRDLERWLRREIQERGYRFDDDVEEEVWMFCIDEAFYFGIPHIKAKQVKGRRLRTEERIASLPPPIAAAMAFAAVVKPDDVVLDPVCGSGTLLAEVKGYSPSNACFGIDIDPEAIGSAKQNLATFSHVHLQVGDARVLQLAEKNISLIIANLPFGKTYGSVESNVDLYSKILHNTLSQSDRAKIRALVLTSDQASLEIACSQFPWLSRKNIFTVKIRGELAVATLLKPHKNARP